MFENYFNQGIQDFYSNPLAVAIVFGLLTFIISFGALMKSNLGKKKKDKNVIVIISLIIGFISFYYFPKMNEGIAIFNLLLIFTLGVIAFKLLIIPLFRFLKINF